MRSDAVMQEAFALRVDDGRGHDRCCGTEGKRAVLYPRWRAYVPHVAFGRAIHSVSVPKARPTSPVPGDKLVTNILQEGKRTINEP